MPAEREVVRKYHRQKFDRGRIQKSKKGPRLRFEATEQTHAATEREEGVSPVYRCAPEVKVLDEEQPGAGVSG